MPKKPKKLTKKQLEELASKIKNIYNKLLFLQKRKKKKKREREKKKFV